MTFPEVHRDVNKFAKRAKVNRRISPQSVHYHLKQLGIESRGVARPAIYQDDAAKKVSIRLGFLPANANGKGHK